MRDSRVVSYVNASLGQDGAHGTSGDSALPQLEDAKKAVPRSATAASRSASPSNDQDLLTGGSGPRRQTSPFGSSQFFRRFPLPG